MPEDFREVRREEGDDRGRDVCLTNADGADVQRAGLISGFRYFREAEGEEEKDQLRWSWDLTIRTEFTLRANFLFCD